MKKFKIIVKMIVTYVLLLIYTISVTMFCTDKINKLYRELEEVNNENI